MDLPQIDPLRAAVESVLLVVDTPVRGPRPRSTWARGDPRGAGADARQFGPVVRGSISARSRAVGACTRGRIRGCRGGLPRRHADGLSRAAMETRRRITAAGDARRCRRCAASASTASCAAGAACRRGGEDPSTGAHLYTTNLLLEQLNRMLDQADLAPLLPDVIIDEPTCPDRDPAAPTRTGAPRQGSWSADQPGLRQQ